VQPLGHAVFVPSHVSGAQDGLPAYPSGAGVQVPLALAPSAWLHTSHCPLHALSQQKPSAQLPLAQVDAPPGHAWPAFSLQLPIASQVSLPLQVAGSSIPMTATHAPVPVAHVMHVAGLHALMQQTPSSQTPLRQSEGLAHVPPGCALQMPVASQLLPEVHVSGSGPFVTATHAPVPATHVMHVPAQAPAQHTPSSQTPPAQSEATLHGAPALALQAPVASHVFMPVHVSGSSLPVTEVQAPVPGLQV
jgi:hypothetical protein